MQEVDEFVMSLQRYCYHYFQFLDLVYLDCCIADADDNDDDGDGETGEPAAEAVLADDAAVIAFVVAVNDQCGTGIYFLIKLVSSLN